MTLQLYYNNSPDYYVSKDLTTVGSSITVTPYEALNINHPVFIVDSLNYAPRVNFAKVTFDNGDVKYYYCTLSLNNGGQNIIACDIDPLMTNAAAIRNCPATVLRYSNKQGRTGPTMFPDSKLPIIPNKKEITSTILRNSFFDINAAYSYILSVIGDDST